MRAEPNAHYIFRRDQVLSLDTAEFVDLFDPRRFDSFQLRARFGAVSLEIEHAELCGEICTIPEGRNLIRALHASWPYAAFFLDLKRPFGPARALGAWPILAYALCVVDIELVEFDASAECTVRLDQNQLRRFRDIALYTIEQLGQVAEIPPEVLFGRKRAITKQLDKILDIA
jgi:hypothetical protein